MASETEIVCNVALRTVNFWPTLAIDILGFRQLHLVLDTASFRSSISESLREELEVAGRLQAHRDTLLGLPAYLLDALSIEGQTLPDVRVLVSPTVTRHRIDGVLGLSFLQNFREVRFSLDDMKLTLVRRA